jgi:transposase-like protein
MTLADLEKRFPTEDACKAYLVSVRWPDGVHCPRCESPKVYKVGRPWNWVCKQCTKKGYRFSPLVGTIFENTNIALRTWFRVIYLMCQSKKGMSALQVHRMIGTGSYRSAWYMCHRIRAAMKSTDFLKLTGTVEVDETYIGGKAKNRHLAGRTPSPFGGPKRGSWVLEGKTAVIGAIARMGNVIAQVIQNTKAATLKAFVRQSVSDDVELIATDELPAYKGLSRDGYNHESVAHRRREYVRGVIHTANIDSFWSMIKRGIMGSFHQVSPGYLPLYLNEFSFRYNNRDLSNAAIFEAVIASA